MHELMRQFGNRQGLQPDPAWAHEGGEKDSIAAEDHVLDAGNSCDLKRDTGLKCPDVAGVDAQHLSGSEVLDDQFSGKLDPARTLAGHLLQKEPVAAKDSGAQRLLETDPQLN